MQLSTVLEDKCGQQFWKTRKNRNNEKDKQMHFGRVLVFWSQTDEEQFFREGKKKTGHNQHNGGHCAWKYLFSAPFVYFFHIEKTKIKQKSRATNFRVGKNKTYWLGLISFVYTHTHTHAKICPVCTFALQTRATKRKRMFSDRDRQTQNTPNEWKKLIQAGKNAKKNCNYTDKVMKNGKASQKQAPKISRNTI